LAAVGAAGGILILQAVRLAARWRTCCLPARPRAPYGPYGRERACSEEGWAGLLGAAGWLVRRETDPELTLGAILNTIQSSLFPSSSLPTHHAYIQTHPPSPPQGCALGPPMWPWRCGLTACPVSGVEWSGALLTSQSTNILHSAVFIHDVYQSIVIGHEYSYCPLIGQYTLLYGLARVACVSLAYVERKQQCDIGVDTWGLDLLP